MPNAEEFLSEDVTQPNAEDFLTQEESGTPQDNFSSRLTSDLGNRWQNIKDLNAKANSGQINPYLAGFHALGQAGLTIPDLLANIDKSIPDQVKERAGQGFDMLAPGLREGLGQYAQGAQNLGNKIGNTETGQQIAPLLEQAGDAYHGSVASDLVNFAGLALPVAKGAEMAAGAAESIPELASSLSERLPQGISNLLADETSANGPISNTTKAIANKITPTIDPQTAQLVQDAAGLGINIPARVFAPGTTSEALSKVGLMGDDTMKADVTTALSKIMGHEGTPNLDVDTMNGIQKNIGNAMNNFALKADQTGGIPFNADDLTSIAEESNADDSKITKLVKKIQSRITGDFPQYGTLSGEDYQALTKKGSLLDKAMKSSDSDLADTAKEIRQHLDNQLEKAVAPEDLAAFQQARQQYRTMKIIQPLVESGGVTGQPDSATKLFNAVTRNYGSLQNALKFNPSLGKIAQVVNEFPEAVKETPKTTFLGKAAKVATGGAAPILVGAVGGAPAAMTAGAILPSAYGVGKYLSSPTFRDAILEKASSIPGVVRDGAAALSEDGALANAEDFSNQLSQKYGIDVGLQDTKDGLHLSSIKVPQDMRKQGIGTQAMRDIIDYADSQGKRLTLTPTTDFGATSVNRLKDFNKRFGFLENKGANKDFSTRETMIRPPKKFAKGGLVPKFTHKQWASYVQKYGKKNKHSIKDKSNPEARKKAYEELSIGHSEELKSKLGREANSREVELSHYITPQGTHRLLKQKNEALEAHKMFPKDIVEGHREIFFNKRKPYTVGQIRKVISS